MSKQRAVLSAIASLLLLSATPAFAESEGTGTGQAASEQSERRGPPPGGRHRGPRLTDAQRSCLEGVLGKPGEGERPSREKMHAAMESCGVPKPPRGGRPPRSESNGEEAQGQQE